MPLCIVICGHPLGNGFGASMKPHDFAAVLHAPDITRVGHYTPAGGDYLPCPSTKPLEQVAFPLAEVFPTPILDNLLNIHTFLGLQFIIHIHENPAESVRDYSAYSALAGAAKANEVQIHDSTYTLKTCAAVFPNSPKLLTTVMPAFSMASILA